MKNFIKITVLIISLSLSALTYACTTIGLARSDLLEGGGTLIFKNRDAWLNQYQKLILLKPQNKIPYIALAYTNRLDTSKNISPDKLDSFVYMTNGTNKYGLTIVVNDPATDEPENVNSIQTNMIRKVLENYKSVADVYKNRDKIFKDSGASLYALADSNSLMNVQVRKDGNFEIQEISRNKENSWPQGYIWNTNLYTLPTQELAKKHNKDYLASTYTRAETISKWLASKNEKMELGDILTIMNQQKNGDNNSIKRTLTVAKYYIHYVPKQPIVLHAIFTIPTQKYDDYTIVLDDEFFSQKAGFVSSEKYGLLKIEQKEAATMN